MKNVEADLVVMGSGLAGLSAAVTGVKKGLKVAVFEKRPFQGGGVSNTPMMTCAVRKNDEYRDKAFKIHMNYTNWNANPAVVRTWINNSYRIPTFIEDLGIKFEKVVQVPLEKLGVERGYEGGFPNAYNIGDIYYFKARGKGHGAAIICKRAAEKFRELGGEIYFNTPIKSFIKENDKVTGAIATDKDGNEIKISAKAIIVASGGFSNNPELIKKYTGHTYTNNNCDNGGNVLFNTFPNAQMTGDGQMAVWAIKGAKGAMGINGHNLVPGPGIMGNSGWIVFNETRTMQEQPYLWVNQLGQRFINEEMSNDHMTMGTAIANQKGKCAYIIFDENTVKHMEEEGLDYIYHIFPAEKLHNVHEQFEELINVKRNNHVFLADTIEELCEKTEINYENMKETILNYNSYCENGHDEEFAKNPSFLRPLKNSKFYAMRVFKGGYQAMGGIKINGKCEVLDKEYSVIKGLYAAGDCAVGEVFGNPPIGGIGMTTVSFSQGFASADEACKYK
ncbi:FAD-binding protein [Clostridium sp. SHJSY1]|uniref:FAD-dependent oxidoreductase n=1 Tax=Clostridium sp. SHJSY1 TaxID=2942483 RepID=UPI0028742AC1|nr:FAD-binding protein [Clostridium sp. SHJSY1]MDS0528563.1 FAD-binding protein [Clostridium sp. SHJSY1]